MAGDYVMIQHATARKIELRRVAASLGVTHAHALGLCVLAWMFFDEQTSDGVAVGATPEMLDEVVGFSGFSHALRDVGWLQVRQGSLAIPRFDRLMGESAKKRANDAARQRKKRRTEDDHDEVDEESRDERDTVTEMSRDECDENVTKEKERKVKKREELSTPPPRDAWREIPIVKENPPLADAIAFWLANWPSLNGGPAGDEGRIDARLSEALSAGWSVEKIVRSIRFSVTRCAKRWLDPDDDWDKKPQRNGRRPAPSVGTEGM